MGYPTLYWEDVKEGQDIESYEYEINWPRLVAAVRASGIYDYVHFDRDYAQAAGLRDAFVGTYHVTGGFGRVMTDWTGPEADIRRLSFRMLDQSCPGDIWQVTGKVTRKYQGDDGEYLVDLDLNIAHQRNEHVATASSTVALPSRVGGPVKVREGGAQKPEIPLDPELPDFARPFIGKVIMKRHSISPVEETQIRHWCEFIEDWNPLYWDKEFAAKSRYGSLKVPPGMYHVVLEHIPASFGIGYLKPGEKVPDSIQRGLHGLELLQELRAGFLGGGEGEQRFMPPGCNEQVATNSVYHYLAPIRPGDLIYMTNELANCSGKKKTRLGEGYFATSLWCWYNQRDELVATNIFTLFDYPRAS